ncbi:MAG TPA: ParB N-terminal domain-containing protein [Candidatus Angelobacter sp.]|nr:ParB N-terminal domain-containing protein [Candidatus Angelobacter sp.]
MEEAVEPDGRIDKLEPRHKVTDQNLLKRLEESMKDGDWIGRPLVVAKIKQDGGYRYEGITGCHRATAAMNVGLPIPAVFVSPEDMRPEQWEFVMTHSEDLGILFDKVELPKAAELMRQEAVLGNTAAEVKPPKRDKTKGRRFSVKRAEPR